MTDTTMENQPHGIPEERRFVWRNLDAFLAGDLTDEERERIEAFLCDCPYTKEYVETEREFAEAVKRCVNEDAAKCPESLRTRVLEALDKCDIEDAPDDDQRGNKGRLIGFPWLGAIMLSAASVMLVVALVLTFGGGPQSDSLPEGLQPMVASVSLDAPKSDQCRYRDANSEYTTYFSDGPELPHFFEGKMLLVSDWNCDEVDGRRVMRAVYDTPDGKRFGLIVFNCDCLDDVVAEELKCVEVVVGDKIVVMWREGSYFRALVGRDAATLHKHVLAFRKSY